MRMASCATAVPAVIAARSASISTSVVPLLRRAKISIDLFVFKKLFSASMTSPSPSSHRSSPFRGEPAASRSCRLALCLCLCFVAQLPATLSPPPSKQREEPSGEFLEGHFNCLQLHVKRTHGYENKETKRQCLDSKETRVICSGGKEFSNRPSTILDVFQIKFQ